MVHKNSTSTIPIISQPFTDSLVCPTLGPGLAGQEARCVRGSSWWRLARRTGHSIVHRSGSRKTRNRLDFMEYERNSMGYWWDIFEELFEEWMGYTNQRSDIYISLSCFVWKWGVNRLIWLLEYYLNDMFSMKFVTHQQLWGYLIFRQTPMVVSLWWWRIPR